MKNVTLKVNYIHHECDPDIVVFTLPDDANVSDFKKLARSVLGRSCDDEEYDFLDVLEERLEEIISHYPGDVSYKFFDCFPVDANF